MIETTSAWAGLELIVEDILDRFNIGRDSCIEFGVEFDYSAVVFSKYFKKVKEIDGKQAGFIKTRIAERLNECRLSMNEAKAKIVYYRNDQNRKHPETASSFDFLNICLGHAIV